MKCLTNKECSEWLAKRGLSEAPYGAWRTAPPFYKQFRLPERTAHLRSFFRNVLLHAVESFKESLIRVTDWSLYEPEEMEVVRGVRQGCGESAQLIEKPGHVFSEEERDLLVGFITLVSGYEWSAYVYFDHGLTLLSWEGEIMDLWSSDPKQYEEMCEAMKGWEVGVKPKTGDG